MKSCDSTRSIRCSCLRWTMAAASLATIACTGISTLIVCWVTSCNAFCQCTVLVVNWSARWTSSLCARHLASSHAYSSTRALAAAIHSGSPWPARRKNYSIRLHARTHHFDPVSDEFFPLKHHINTVFLSVTPWLRNSQFAINLLIKVLRMLSRRSYIEGARAASRTD